MRTAWLVLGIVLGGLAASTPAAAGEPASAAPEATRVVARVRTTEITYAELKARVELLERERGPVPVARYGEVLQAMVREEVLVQVATDENLEQDTQVKVRLEQVRRHILIDELLKKKLATLGPVTDEEIRRVYEANLEHFTQERRRISHIMVAGEAEAQSIRQALEAGQDFAALARAKSQDSGSAEKGGDLGLLDPGMAEPEFEAAASRLGEGEVSPVVKTQQGYHILKGGAREKVVEPLEAVRGRIAEMLEQQKRQNLVAVYVTSMERIAMPEIFEQRLQ